MQLQYGYRPIPEGYISLLDYAKAHGKDIVSLACAAWRRDIPAWNWILKTKKGVRYQDVKVLVVKEDAVCPAYVEPMRAAHGSEGEPVSEEESYGEPRKRVKHMAAALGVSESTAGSYLMKLGLDIKDCQSEIAYQVAIAKCKALQEQMWAARPGNYKIAGIKRNVVAPDGYETVEAAAKRMGCVTPWIKTLARQGRIPSVKKCGCVFVQKGVVYQRKYGNQWTVKAKEGKA